MIRTHRLLLKTASILIASILGLAACDPASPELAPNFTKGKNRFTTVVNGDTREYFVHIPDGYDGTTAFPVVFMLHGSSGDGEKFYNISGWKEVGEAQNIITVFPSSWHYCVIEDGGTKNTTKWNANGSFGFCAGEVPRDDEKFLATIITELEAKFKIDAKRVYLEGFSNGGTMVSKCLISMSDKFAVIAANAGSLDLNVVAVPKQKIPFLLQVGNRDPNLMEGLGTTSPIPMNFTQLFSQYPSIQGSINSFINVLGLNTTYTVSGNENTQIIARFASKTANSPNDLYFALVKDLEHEFPNGTNHVMKGAEVHWQ